MNDEVFSPPVYNRSQQFGRWGITPPDVWGLSARVEDDMESGLDLNFHLIRNKPATFLMRVSGDAMTGAGIFNGDLVVVDRSLKAVDGKIVIAMLNGEMLIRRFEKTFNKIRLIPDTKRLAPIDIDLSVADFSIWGVVTYCIHSL